jgi:hypothetical protein
VADRREEEVKLHIIGVVVALLGAAGLTGQDLPNWVLTLSKIKRQAKAELANVPNYACLEIVIRSRRPRGAAAFKPMDTLRFEVAFIGNKELFAPEGAAQFQDASLRTFAAEGAIGNGEFAGVARNLLVNSAGRVTDWGAEKLGRRDALWYGYEISALSGALLLQGNGVDAWVGERGRFWVDAETLGLLRIEDHAVDIPLALGMKDVTMTITYGKVAVGASAVLLPTIAETLVTERDGSVERTLTEFARCREYGSESTIRFGPDDATAKKK